MSSILRTFFGEYNRPIAEAPHRPEPLSWRDSELTASWLGHATVLINFFGFTILTDPTFFPRVGIRIGPLTVGPKRYVRCALQPRELPFIDLVLLSHAHMDHMDLRSLRKVRKAGFFVTASQTADVFRWERRKNVRELAWGETCEIPGRTGTAKIRAYKLRHWGARVRWDDHRTYNAYTIERNGIQICFAGDTAWTSATELGSTGQNALILSPIGAYDPWVRSHCNPEEAVQMANEARARYVMPIHHQTFRLSREPMDEPIRRFEGALAREPERIALNAVGQTFQLAG